MHFNDLRRVFPAILDSQTSVELISAPGRGKSTFVKEFIDERNANGEDWGFAVCFLATMTPPDLIGYIFKGEREYDGKTIAVSEPTAPLWMFTDQGQPLSHHKRGVLFLDEYGQGETDVKRASAELLLNRQLGPWKLPEGWSVVAASNRTTDRSGVTKSLDFVINRRVELHVTDDLNSLTEWMWKHEVDPTFIAFTETNPHIVFTDGVPEKQGPWCTPRSIVMCANLLGRMRDPEGNIPIDATAVELASGIIGEAAAAQLIATIKLGLEMPKYEDIIAKPDKVKVPGKPDALMLVSYNLAARVTKADAGPVVAYMKRFPKEFAVGFMKIAVKRDAKLLLTDAFEDWVDENATLMSVINNVAA